ncbi:MAG: hypothetical protein AAF282_05405 [Cyanobacteria bacterium P01_A01_bin.15]
MGKGLVTVAVVAVVLGHGVITPAHAIPGWQFIRELFSGGRPAVGSPRGGTRNDIPYIITPRKTAILTPVPEFRWHPVPRALSYTVTLRGPEGIVWTTTVAEPRITYGGEPALEPGVPYSLTVKAEAIAANSTLTSTEEGLPGLAFYLLPNEQRTQLMEAVGTLQPPDTLAESLALAKTYRDYNLMGEAISLLERYSSAGTTSIELNRLLGELYLQVRLNRNARDVFEQARALAESAGDLRQQADINSFLAHIALGMRQPDEARQHLAEAEALYINLGDGAKADSVNAWLAVLNADS